MISFEIYEGEERQHLRKEIIEYLDEGFKVEFKEIKGRFFGYKSYIHIPSIEYLEKLQHFVEAFFDANNFKTEVTLTVRFGRINRIFINYEN